MKNLNDRFGTNDSDIDGPGIKPARNAPLDIDRVNMKSIRLDDVKMSDYPDFCDAFISEAAFKDGTWLSDEEMEELQGMVDMNELAMAQVL